MADPIPCIDLQIISISMELENTATIEVAKNIITPYVHIFFNPTISANLPNGREKIAVKRIKEVNTQFNSIASALNSFPITGKATFREVVINAERLPTRVAIISITFLLLLPDCVPFWFEDDRCNPVSALCEFL
jgi:hypothetical protein